jgi:glutamate 5-kinase
LINLPDAKSETVQKQIFASIGQVKLMSIYSELLARDDFFCAQVLVTKEDFRDDTHYMNIKNCLEGLLVDNIIPIINENDVVATTELMFTDNDELAGYVADQLKADCLIILTSTPGILDKAGKTVHSVDATNMQVVSEFIHRDKSTGGRGGMISKFEVAKRISAIGIPVYIAEGRRQNVVIELYEGKDVGTKFI